MAEHGYFTTHPNRVDRIPDRVIGLRGVWADFRHGNLNGELLGLAATGQAAKTTLSWHPYFMGGQLVAVVRAADESVIGALVMSFLCSNRHYHKKAVRAARRALDYLGYPGPESR